ncbi:RecX family transcriptional regulator [Teichococcus oryzae]|uniref:Regulatory protein RecX n=1 Tax=Teichococcus oryzae TaxID=1608942 RepID=A0A5B2TJZ8_9PROT|nr:RecX family transcriptional regulator [Pseudoroseomonas oryzae]KAA2214509.1 RecX family transcriptional regulator [Pseudoroseomonas oryzae]
MERRTGQESPRGQRRRAEPRPAGPPPGAGALREAALAHLARFAATEAGLVRVLHRRIDRWARRAEAEAQPTDRIAAAIIAARADAVEVARRLVAAGAVDDAAFAASRARRLNQAGRSRRAIQAHLAAKGVTGETASTVLEEAEPDELAAALGHLRRRRAGPFAPRAPDAPLAPEARLKALGALARAGFPRDVAERALDMDPDEAEQRLLDSRRG